MNDDPNYFRDNYQELLRMSKLQDAAQKLEQERYRIMRKAHQCAEETRLSLCNLAFHQADTATKDSDHELYECARELVVKLSMAKGTASRYLNHVPEIDD